MPVFHVFLRGDDQADSYWIKASSYAVARRLIALNVAGAEDARDRTKFGCAFDSGNPPPADFIHRRLLSPVPITKR